LHDEKQGWSPPTGGWSPSIDQKGIIHIFIRIYKVLTAIILMDLKDKVVIITGSSQGIGKATALEFLRAGSLVMLNGRNPEKLLKTKEEFEALGFQPLAKQGDLSDPNACKELIDETLRNFGRIDILVNNAGGGFRGRMDGTSAGVIRNVIDSNLMSAIFCTEAAMSEIKKNRGSIVFISSLSGIRGMPKNGPYCIAKMGLTALAQTLRLEMSGTGVHIGIIYVGWTDFDENKRVINADGSLIPITRKSKQTREQVAKIILRTIRRKKFKVVLTFPGKVLAFFNRFCPPLLDWAMKRSEKTQKYNN
jgi:NAD(P)-dependent dehydrogenase (short-subunit alcohol dehydrogenase family)